MTMLVFCQPRKYILNFVCKMSPFRPGLKNIPVHYAIDVIDTAAQPFFGLRPSGLSPIVVSYLCLQM